MRASLVLLAAMVTVAYAVGQYYVPRSYYTIDSDGHETAPVPLRRLRRSVAPYPYYSGSANADARANANAGGGGNANARADANANAYGRGQGSGDYQVPAIGSAGPNVLSSGMTRRQFGAVRGNSVSARTDVGMDSLGNGYYGLSASVDD